ncbi:MAG: hypothetical protein OXC31_06430 [Spirochaetaceae bacterium]|nr:hypothetical protein [Spirochaetaceae bacterium]
MPERGPKRAQVGTPGIPERYEPPPRPQYAHRLPSNRCQRALQVALPCPQPLEPNERIIGVAKRSEAPARRLLTDHEMWVEVEDLVDHTREHLASRLVPIGANVQQPDTQGPVVSIQKLGAHLAGVEPRRPSPLIRGSRNRPERFVVDEKPALTIGWSDECGFLSLGEPAVRSRRVKIVETAIAPSP